MRNRLGGNVRLMIVGSDTSTFTLINISLSNITSRDITLSNITFSDITLSDITLIWNIYPGRLRWPAMCSPSCAPPLVASSWRGELTHLWWSYLIRFHFKSDQFGNKFSSQVRSDWVCRSLHSHHPRRSSAWPCEKIYMTCWDELDYERINMFQNILSLERWHFPLNIKSQQRWRKGKGKHCWE